MLVLVYLAIAFWALFTFTQSPFNGACRNLSIAIGIIVSAGPPLYFWLEARAFDWWLNRKFPNVENEEQNERNKEGQKLFRETYKLNADNLKAFWAGILAVYAAVLWKG